MLQVVPVKPKSIDRYRQFVGDGLIDEIVDLGRRLRGRRVLHLNATAYGGGVSELLLSLVALELDAGLDVEWRTLDADEAFFAVTKDLHNGLQGKRYTPEAAQWQLYLDHNADAARTVGDYDGVIVHDPQPAAVRSFTDGEAYWIWRCHIDSSRPDPDVWAKLRPHVQKYDTAIFTMAQFVPPDLQMDDIEFIAPAIDPLSSKNRELPEDLAQSTVAEFGVDVTRPLLLQVARFDPWKDPKGTIEAYRLVKGELPDVQLALVGSMAEDDPEGWEVYRTIVEDDRSDDDLFTFTNLVGVGSLEVNCFQRVADVAIQKSIREGFGLAVSEAVWKGTPVVGGATGGIPLQIQDGVGGFLVTTVEQCAERVRYLLSHPNDAQEIVDAGRRRTAEQFLMPRLVRDELRLIEGLLSARRNGESSDNDEAQ